MSDNLKLNSAKLKNFLNVMGKSNLKPDVDLDVSNLNQPSSFTSPEIQELKKTMQSMQEKLNLFLKSKHDAHDLDVDKIQKTLRYLKERMDLVVDHKKIKGEITKVEMKQLKINILKDKIDYLEKKLDSILQQREKKLLLEKEYDMLKKEKLTGLASRVLDLEKKLAKMMENPREKNKVLIMRIKQRINKLKQMSSDLLYKKGDSEIDAEFKVIEHISKILEEKKQELHDQETELMIEKGIVEPEEMEPEVEKKQEKVKMPKVVEKPTIREQVKRSIKSKKKLDIKSETRLQINDFELPALSTKLREFDLELPSPVPLEEFHEEKFVPTPRPIEQPEKKKKKGFFAKLLNMLKIKKKEI